MDRKKTINIYKKTENKGKKKQDSSWFRTILGYEGDGEGPFLRLCDIWEHTGFYFKKMDKDEVKVNLGKLSKASPLPKETVV